MLTTALLLLSVVSADSLTGTGVSHELARLRARDISHVSYSLRLDVTRPDTAYGHVIVHFTRTGKRDGILDFRGPAFSAVSANGNPSQPAWKNGHLVFPASQLKNGSNTIELDFRSAIAPAGASIIRFHDATDGADYLYTLLVPADANQLFPCFDQPDLKARLTLTLVTPQAWKALGNGTLMRTDTAAELTHHFAASDPISTYLMAFAAGPWSTKTATMNGRTVSIYVRASRAKEAESDTLIALNTRAIAWLEKYTARPFPFQKFDFLLAPAFPFGGMEHPGAIFYNEESFIYRERPTLSQLLGREATIFHEVAHQWFGDLVTMRWFDDLWLKEGFSTYLAAVMQADLTPRANAWKTFYLRNKPAAYSVDASTGTTPVWQSLANLDQAKSNYGAIVYNKAPGILKQLNYLVGDTAFKRGLRTYLNEHAYGNATWQDLLSAVGRAGRRDLGSWGSLYVLTPGMPVITQSITNKAAGLVALTLAQQPARSLSGAAVWPVKTEMAFGYADGRVTYAPALLSGSQVQIAIPPQLPDFVFSNAHDYAYGLVRLDDKSRTWLVAHVGEVHDDFLRAMLWGTLWDEVRDARLSPSTFISAVLRAVPNESDEQLVPVLLGRLSRAVGAYVAPASRDSILPDVERTLLAMANDSGRTYGVRKNAFDTYIGTARTPAALVHLNQLLDSSSAAGAPLRPPTRWAIVTALIARGAPTAMERLAAETRRDSTSEGKRRAFVAGAAQPDPAVKAAYFARYFSDRSLNEDWVTASLGAFHDPSRDDLSRPYLIPALDSLKWVQNNRRIFFLGNWISSTLNGQRSEEALNAVDAFLAERKLPADLRQKILQSRDELERTVAIRRAFRCCLQP